MESGQKKIKRKGGGDIGSGSGSAWEAKEEIELPDAGNIMDEIDYNVDRTKHIVVQKQKQRRRTGCCY